MHKFKKRLFIIAIAITTIVVVVILSISPIAKYLIEKYDERSTGRQIV